jgi:hypothetical protein
MLRGLLKEHAEEIAGRWFEDGLSDYSADAHEPLRRVRDRFANPLGHGLRTGTRALFDAVLDGADEGTLQASLDEIVRIRAVQQMSPSGALGFLFRLKGLIRAQLGDAVEDPLVQSELVELDQEIDRAALTAFDLFVAYREQVLELRIEEIKRNTPWFVSKTSQSALEQELP